MEFFFIVWLTGFIVNGGLWSFALRQHLLYGNDIELKHIVIALCLSIIPLIQVISIIGITCYLIPWDKTIIRGKRDKRTYSNH